MQEALTSAALKQTNRRRIYQYIYQSPQPVTKQEIAGALGLSLPTVSGNLNEFLEEELLSYSGTQASTGGRKPRTISLVANARFSVGISIMDDAVRLVAINIRAKELGYQKVYKKFCHSPRYYQEVAQLLGVSRPAYTYYERGKTLPDVVGLYQLARFYHKPMEAFFQPCPESKKEDIP